MYNLPKYLSNLFFLSSSSSKINHYFFFYNKLYWLRKMKLWFQISHLLLFGEYLRLCIFGSEINFHGLAGEQLKALQRLIDSLNHQGF